MIDRLVADTSLLVNFFNGHQVSKQYLQNSEIWISGITEIEILSFPKLSAHDKRLIKDFLKSIYIVDLEQPVKEITIDLRSTYRFKLSDAVIAATAIYLNMPLFTFDSDFKRIDKIADIVLMDL
jgi:predicted nucleic acid-binding protein